MGKKLKKIKYKNYFCEYVYKVEFLFSITHFAFLKGNIDTISRVTMKTQSYLKTTYQILQLVTTFNDFTTHCHYNNERVNANINVNFFYPSCFKT